MASLMHPVRARRSGIACVLLLLYLPACWSWHVGTPTPAQFVERERPQAVRVTLTDGTTIEAEAPLVRGDSLVGTLREQYVEVVRGDGLVGIFIPPDSTVSLALSDVRFVEVSRFSLGKTLLAIVVVATTGVAILCIGLAAKGWGCL